MTDNLKNLLIALKHYVAVTTLLDDRIVEQAYNDIIREIDKLIKEVKDESI